MKSWTRSTTRNRNPGAYLLMEALVYMGVVVVILAVGYAAMYRCVDSVVVLRRDAEDISRALNAGERWRTEVRQAVRGIRWEVVDGERELHLDATKRQIAYRFASGAVYRRIDAGPWVLMLGRVQSCGFQPVPAGNFTAWRWDLELQPEVKGALKAGRVRPLFTFISVPQSTLKP